MHRASSYPRLLIPTPLFSTPYGGEACPSLHLTLGAPCPLQELNIRIVVIPSLPILTHAAFQCQLVH